ALSLSQLKPRRFSFSEGCLRRIRRTARGMQCFTCTSTVSGMPIKISAKTPSQPEPLPTKNDKNDRRGEWRDYDADFDDYDPRTAPLAPPPVDKNALLRRQALHLRSRAARVDTCPAILQHYVAVAEELEAAARPWKEFKHRRTASAQSTVSTVVPEDNISDSEEEEDEVPQEVRGCTDIRQFAKKALPGLPCSRTSMPARLAPPVLGPL
ncbi:unnamed protein product, partial [Effrenium voratum]